MENDNKQREKEDKKTKGIIAWILLGISIAGNGLLIYLLNLEQKKVVEREVIYQQVVVERDNVRGDLLKLKDEYATLQTNDVNLQAEINEKRAQIEELLKEAEKHKGDAYMIGKLKKEAETLRNIMKGYVHTIDSLNTLNQKLIVEKNDVLKDLSKEKDKTTTLNKEKEQLQATINKGSILSCSNIVVNGINLKSGGKKQVTTSKARRADVIRVSFTLGENKIAKSGDKPVFVRIMTPDGKEMAKSYDESYRFFFNGSPGYYAGKTIISYNNSEIGVTALCEGNAPLIPGKYIVEITADGVVIGQSTLELD